MQALLIRVNQAVIELMLQQEEQVCVCVCDCFVCDATTECAVAHGCMGRGRGRVGNLVKR